MRARAADHDREAHACSSALRMLSIYVSRTRRMLVYVRVNIRVDASSDDDRA